MEITLDTIRQIFEHRLHQADIDRLLKDLSESQRGELLLKIGELIRRTSALVEIANKVSDTLSLDILFPRLMEVVTETVNAERSTLFLHDPETRELFSRVLQGDAIGEIRFPSNAGIAGSVFTSGQSVIIADAYADPRFNPEIDRKTGYRTRNILCVPLRNKKREIIGVTQVLNKVEGSFSADDEKLLESLTSQAAAALENAQLFEKVERAQREEALLLDVTSSIVSELQLDPLLAKIVAVAADLLDAERGTLFLYDAKTGELVSRVAEDLEIRELRFPATAGIAGECFTSGGTINIPDAYADPRFNPEVDRKTSYRTRSILCMQIQARTGRRLGVMQILNKKRGPFGAADERRLKAFASQAAISLENAQLFDELNNAHNYNESILKSLSNGVITLDAERRINKLNLAAMRILRVVEPVAAGKSAEEVFTGKNGWIAKSIEKVATTGRLDITVDTDVVLPGREAVAVNLTTVPLVSVKDEPLGFMLVIEDISREKRLKNTMSRYMSKAVMDRLLEVGEAALGGTGQEVSVLFSDIRGFTVVSEKIGARETVSMLNEYFTEMVDIVFAHNGILDKYIGDAIMAVFGSPFTSEEDADNSVIVGNKMIVALRALNQRRTAVSKDPITIGIGISTGEVVAGNIGSLRRMEYTVIGDRVNLAARLEAANKHYGTSILVSEFTARRLRKPALLREIDLIRIRGGSRPVAIYEAIGHHTEESFPNLERALVAFAEGLERYRKQEWHRAIECFQAVLHANPVDQPAQLFLDRCKHYRMNPPDPAWDGVWTIQAK
ncbi:MAG: GAF domain-containing protein [Rhodocyclales bacterium]|nr:GAF domain-containing protein [Rhodocyclales bacterium]